LLRISSGDGIKEAFKIADRLRKAGYVAELDLDGKERGEGWILEVRSKSPVLTLINKAKSKRTEAQSVDEVLKQLEGEGGN
jgi:hypothetical protein